jgi:hypothetical protein
MNNMTLKMHNMARATVVVLNTASMLLACNDAFDDSDMSELKKPELISVVLDPPEASPGDRVRATYLFADQRGVLVDREVIWIPFFTLADQGGRRRTTTGDAMLDPDQDLDTLMQPVFTLAVGEPSLYVFDRNGFAEHTVGLIAFISDIPQFDSPHDIVFDELDQLLDSEDTKLGIRTLVVSNRTTKNQNPRVVEIRWGLNSTIQSEPIEIVRNGDLDLAVSRQRSADEAIEVDEKQALFFNVQIEDDDPIQETIRYQWIATGGDFDAYREQIQPWTAPSYREPDPEQGEQDQRAQINVEPRIDPNLHTVWVIVRDNGIYGQLGQCWAEFYVRILPK